MTPSITKNDDKCIILAEIPVEPVYLDYVKSLAAATLKPTLEEAGCEAFYQTARSDDPNSLVFFEVFRSKDAHDLHLKADYTRAFFAGVQDKTSGKPIITFLNQL
ncbi:putative quinol monooxygenase [Chitinophaga ginsengisoli]|nr:putative quinol monooxygenase [Chitinophaga ginsengisoli]